MGDGGPTPWVDGGRVLRAHGVAGALRLRLALPWASLSPPPARLRLVVDRAARERLEGQQGPRPDDTMGIERAIVEVRPADGDLLVQLQGLGCREVAELLRGALVQLPRACLPALEAGEFWSFELPGLEARQDGGGRLGVIVRADASGPQLLAEVLGDDGRLVLIPMVPELVARVDRAGGFVVLRMPAGLWELGQRPAPLAG